ncbi:Chaperone protein DnaJ [Ceratobasidium theobromae]|uniref:Chaperone protein DnaJ n=1 Tax=Ceratobasidium theobromae TaxID=1582974 RepID=A0A5N5QB25_9AGAM|nr:Chaperone protein DnaJ [Ceratobasidium theobromae]
MDWLSQLSGYSSFAYRTIGWWFLPNLVTRTAVTVYYNSLVAIGFSHWIPPPNSPQRLQHYRRAFAIVVLSYLSWTLVQSLLEQPPSFYSLLGVSSDASHAEIKNAYRAFAKRNHPDRVGPAGEPLFGFEALEWKIGENPHAMLWQGLENALRYYLPTGIVMVVMAFMGWGGNTSYWRHFTWALVATLEACIIIGYNPFPLFTHTLKPLLTSLATLPPRAIPGFPVVTSLAPYQWIFFIRETFVSIAVAIGTVVPVLIPPPPTKKEEQARQAEIARLAIGLDPVVRNIIVQSAISDVQAKELVQREIEFLDMPRVVSSLPTEIQLSDSHRAALASLAPNMQRLVVQQTLLSDPQLRDPFLQALDRTPAQFKKEEEEARDLSHHVAFTRIGRDQLTPTPDDSHDLTAGPEDLTASRILAIPSPPSSIFALSRDTTPEPSYARTFDASTPGFNWRTSPGGTPTSNRASSMSDHRMPSFIGSSPTTKGMQRPSLSPSKRPSKLSEVGLASPTSPAMVKQELA